MRNPQKNQLEAIQQLIKNPKSVIGIILAALAVYASQEPWNTDDQNNNQSDQAQVADNESDSSTTSESATESAQATDGDTVQVAEEGTYTSPEEVAAYIDQYDTLPENYITKSEAEDLGWESSDGNLWEVAEGMSIGGDYFGNYEGLLPEEDDHREADVNYDGGFRGAERIIYSDDGDIYYTDDHYESFQQLY
ncbi:ribonuclease domain-containing protein [Aerococcus urinaeequi]|uniref:Ribonuclease n=1 Tax=Aerococcus urinaeequi TaxID=51665 RepID=A0AAC9F3X5_9LACT|nr:ribonuclease domain-containing protein [Aerococcus urinaeequi]AMB97745.1 ribonuclease [Aerococcus urinaeequi]